MKRIGIFAGAFNPIHAGHIAFALQAKNSAQLDDIYFLPERRPRRKKHVEHFGHRVAMIKRALRPHTAFGVLESDDISFDVKRTLPMLRRRFEGDQLVFLVGSDVVHGMKDWQLIEQLVLDSELVVGMRRGDDTSKVKSSLLNLPIQPKGLTILPSHAASVSSGSIRQALQRRSYTTGMLESVRRYADRHWLYVSLVP